jgi:hypothetical protein
MRVVGLAVGAAIVAWVAVMTTYAAEVPIRLGLNDDTAVPVGLALAVLAFAGVVVRERLATGNRRRKLAAFGLQIKAGSELIEDLRRGNADDRKEAFQGRWLTWDAASSELVDREGRPGDHDVYHRTACSTTDIMTRL